MASGRKISSVFRVESIISKIEHDMTSHKEDLSEIKTMIQMLINRQGNREMVARPPVLPKSPDTSGGGGPYDIIVLLLS